MKKTTSFLGATILVKATMAQHNRKNYTYNAINLVSPIEMDISVIREPWPGGSSNIKNHWKDFDCSPVSILLKCYTVPKNVMFVSKKCLAKADYLKRDQFQNLPELMRK